MNYKELQKEAKTLGIKYIGVSASKLKRTIEQAKFKSPAKSPAKNSKPKVNKNVNAAIVRNGKNEVRRYTIDIHGKNFAELAKEFAKSKDRDFKVELIEVKPGITCPDCGNTIYT